MQMQYIQDESGQTTAVIIPIAEWKDITSRHEDLKELSKKQEPGIIKKPSDFAGTMTADIAREFHKHIEESRNQWE
jgi:hypothetical protein